MKRLFICIFALLMPSLSFAQINHSIEIDPTSFKPVNTDPLTGVAIDKIEVDHSLRPCARIKLKINRMTRADIENVQINVMGGIHDVMKKIVAHEGNGLIIELTAKPQTRFYLHHDKYGDSNEVTLNLEGNKEYRLDAQLNYMHTIVVSSNVANSEVYIDEVFKGRTGTDFTLTVNDVVPGQHAIRVQNGSLNKETTVEVNDQNVSFRIELNQAQARPQYAVFIIEPKEASLTIDGKPLMPNANGIASALLSNGSHEYSASANEYYAEKGSIVIDGAKVVKNIKLRPAFGYLSIPASDNLADAGVYVDNSLIGKAPITNHKIANGSHTIRIVKDLYKVVEGTIVIKEAEVTKYAPNLVADFASVTLTTGAGFEIYVDNELKGTSSWSGKLSTGTHIFEARKAGYNTASITQNVAQSEDTITYTIPTPSPITGAININSTPIMSQVLVDGKLVGETPLMHDLTIGKHTISVRMEGYSTSVQEVDIVEGKTEELNITLSRGTKILYTSSDGNVVTPQEGMFDANIISNTYADGQGVMEFDKSITKIADFAFKNCTTLTSIVIPDRVTTIGFEAFYNCTSLQSITIGNGVTSFGKYAFSGCTALTNVTIRNGVTAISDETFKDCSSLRSISIPNSVTRIGNKAFSRCSGLTSVTIGSGVTAISEEAFNGCKSLTSIKVPNSVRTIGKKAFYGCAGLTSVSIGSGVSSIGEDAFAQCGECTVYITDLSAWCRIDFSNSKANPLSCGEYCHKLFINGAEATDITIPSDITSIKRYAFDCCISLKNLIIPNSVTSIGNTAFYYCRGLTSINIPNSVTSIGEWAFAYCDGLTSVTIGNGVTSIGKSAFYHCESLTSVYYKAITPPSLGNYVFNENGSDRKIYVPTASVSAYKSASYWYYYSDSIIGYDF